MTMNPLPPQAYTKETLVKAYQWLQHQSDNIKEMASTPDVLVGLFLKAKMQGESALERPSIQNFKSELKNLAGMMGEFEVVDHGGLVTMPAAPTQSAPQAIAPSPAKPVPHSPSAAQAAHFDAASPPPAAPTQSAPLRKTLPELDTRSWLMIQEVKNQMNLSSEIEALRLLISVGQSKLKALMSDK